MYIFITHLIFRVHYFAIRKLNNFLYFTTGLFFHQLYMRGTLSTAGVHDLVHGNRPEFVAMAVKQPESPCDIGMNDWIMTDSEEERVL